MRCPVYVRRPAPPSCWCLDHIRCRRVWQPPCHLSGRWQHMSAAYRNNPRDTDGGNTAFAPTIHRVVLIDGGFAGQIIFENIQRKGIWTVNGCSSTTVAMCCFPITVRVCHASAGTCKVCRAPAIVVGPELCCVLCIENPSKMHRKCNVICKICMFNGEM